MPPVFTQMADDPVRAAGERFRRQGGWVRKVLLARLAQSRNMVDIDAELHISLWIRQTAYALIPFSCR